jgi:hypothetical protein
MADDTPATRADVDDLVRGLAETVERLPYSGQDQRVRAQEILARLRGELATVGLAEDA